MAAGPLLTETLGQELEAQPPRSSRTNSIVTSLFTAPPPGRSAEELRLPKRQPVLEEERAALAAAEALDPDGKAVFRRGQNPEAAAWIAAKTAAYEEGYAPGIMGDAMGRRYYFTKNPYAGFNGVTPDEPGYLPPGVIPEMPDLTEMSAEEAGDAFASDLHKGSQRFARGPPSAAESEARSNDSDDESMRADSDSDADSAPRVDLDWARLLAEPEEELGTTSRRGSSR